MEPCDDLGERPPTRARRQPAVPSAQEAEEHEVTRYPYRAWCRYCLAASGRRDRHIRGGEGRGLDDKLTQVAIDYTYFMDGAEDRVSPMLVAID